MIKLDQESCGAIVKQEVSNIPVGPQAVRNLDITDLRGSKL